MKTRPQRFQRPDAPSLRGAPVFGDVVPFAATPDPEGWVELAYEVAMSESGVTLTKKDFEQCVANFALYPCVPVVIEHADIEQNPFIAAVAAWREPSGHIDAMRVGTRERMGKTIATLEGKPSYEPELTGKVGAGKKWRYGSIAILQGAVDEETSKSLGSMLWSWSLTAHPRLMGIPALPASLRPGEAVRAGWYYGDIDGRDDLLCMLRCVLDLPVTSTEADVLAELTKLEALAVAPEAAGGVDVDAIVGRLRDALRLPALSTTAEVLAEVRKGLATMPAETSTAPMSRAPGAPAPTPAPGPLAVGASHRTEIAPMKFLPFLSILGLSAVPTEDEAEKKVLGMAQFGADALKAVGLPVTASPAEFAAKVDGIAKASAKVPALEGELAAFRKVDGERVAAERAAHIDDLVAVTPSLAAFRRSLELHAERDAAGFATAYPRPTREQLVAAGAEVIERGQDGRRTEMVTANARNKDAPALPPKPGNVRNELRDILAEFGWPSDAEAITNAISLGHTPATLRVSLETESR